MLKVVTRVGCGRCMIVKNLLKEKGIEFEQISADSEEGKALIDKLELKVLPVVVDGDKVIKVEEVKNL